MIIDQSTAHRLTVTNPKTAEMVSFFLPALAFMSFAFRCNVYGHSDEFLILLTNAKMKIYC